MDGKWPRTPEDLAFEYDTLVEQDEHPSTGSAELARLLEAAAVATNHLRFEQERYHLWFEARPGQDLHSCDMDAVGNEQIKSLKAVLSVSRLKSDFDNSFADWHAQTVYLHACCDIVGFMNDRTGLFHGAPIDMGNIKGIAASLLPARVPMPLGEYPSDGVGLLSSSRSGNIPEVLLELVREAQDLERRDFLYCPTFASADELRRLALTLGHAATLLRPFDTGEEAEEERRGARRARRRDEFYRRCAALGLGHVRLARLLVEYGHLPGDPADHEVTLKKAMSRARAPVQGDKIRLN